MATKRNAKASAKIAIESEIRLQEIYKAEIEIRIGLNKITNGMLKASELKVKHLQKLLK